MTHIFYPVFFVAAIGFSSFCSSEKKSLEKNNDSAQQGKKQLFHINSIKGIIFGVDETHLITTMDVARPSVFDGRTLTEKEYFMRHLLYEQALHYKIPIDDGTVDKYLFSIKKEYNMTDKDIVQMMEEAGFTYTEGRKALKMLYSSNAVMGFRIHDRVIISKEAIQNYYDQHPRFEESKVLITLSSISIPEDRTKDEVRAELERYQTADPLKLSLLSWGEPFWVAESELAHDKKGLLDLSVGQVLMQETAQGFDLFRVKEKKPAHQQPLDDEYYREISEILRKPMLESLRAEYEQELWNRSAILYPSRAPALKQFNVVGLPKARSI